MDPYNQPQQPPLNNVPPESSQPQAPEQPSLAAQPLQPTQYATPLAQPNPVTEDPGRGLAIAGVILAFFMSIIGLILSIVAKQKSKAAGINNQIATVGIVLNIIMLVLGFFVTLFIVFVVLASTNGVQDRANLATLRNYAYSTVSKAEAYGANENGRYPSKLSDFNKYEETSLDIPSSSIASSAPTASSNKITIYACSERGIKIEYWDSSTQAPATVTAGRLSTDTSCSIMQ